MYVSISASVTYHILALCKVKYSSSTDTVCPVLYNLNNFLPEDGDVFDGTPDGRAILLGGLSPLTLPDVLMAP